MPDSVIFRYCLKLSTHCWTHFRAIGCNLNQLISCITACTGMSNCVCFQFPFIGGWGFLHTHTHTQMLPPSLSPYLPLSLSLSLSLSLTIYLSLFKTSTWSKPVHSQCACNFAAACRTVAITCLSREEKGGEGVEVEGGERGRREGGGVAGLECVVACSFGKLNCS